ncbi:MAG: hypothetical protein H0T42_09750 [Deltaproteobacteria bacterium]|nr:hypothetical protein [Deltaproteobacteria bacterium]
MTKLAVAFVMLSACTTGSPEDDLLGSGPDHGDQVGIEEAPRVTGVVRGVAEGRVVLGNDGWLDTREIANGGFAFENVPDGTYFAKLEIIGFASQSQIVVVRQGSASVVLDASPLAAGYAYQWSRDTSRGGHEQGSVIGSARVMLRASYGIHLSDEELVWSDEHAARLLATMRAVPQRTSTLWAPIAMTPTTWILSSHEAARSGDVVRISTTAFATERYVATQLHQNIVAHVTQHGRDRVAVDQILLERYGVRASLFTDAESVTLISMLEDMPQGLRAMPGLTTLTRRSGGAPVRALVASGSLEISDTTFAMDRTAAQFELVREMALFLVPADLTDAVAHFVTTGQGADLVSGLGLEAEAPFIQLAIRAEGRQVHVTLGLEAEGAAAATMFVFNGERYQMLRLEPETTGAVVLTGDVTLSGGGIWRPDSLVLVSSEGAEQVQEMDQVGWRLEAE